MAGTGAAGASLPSRQEQWPQPQQHAAAPQQVEARPAQLCRREMPAPDGLCHAIVGPASASAMASIHFIGFSIGSGPTISNPCGSEEALTHAGTSAPGGEFLTMALDYRQEFRESMVVRASTRPATGPVARGSGVLAAIVAVAVGMSGCGRVSPPPTLVIAMDGVPLTLDPHFHNDAVTWSLLANFYEGLVRFSADMRLEPALASSWHQVTPTLWRFVLRDDARFAGGQRVTAKDVVASLERARENPASQVRHHTLGIASCVADGESAVLVTTEGPRSTLLNRLPFLMVVPAGVAGADELVEVQGSGPYRAESIEPGESIVATARRRAGSERGIERVRFAFSWSQRELVDRFLAGEVDVLRHLPERDLAELRARPGLRAELQPRLQVQMLAVCPEAASGETRRALSDPRVRQALLVATDRERYAREVFRGNAVVASQAVQPVVFGYDPSLQATAYDPDLARVLLRSAGFPDGVGVSLDYTAAQVELVLPVVRDLEQVGFEVRLRVMEWAELLRRSRGRESELSLFAWGCSTGDASDFLNACAHSPAPERGLGTENYSGHADAATDSLIERAEGELDRERRLQLLQAAQARVLASCRVVPLTVRFQHLGVSDRVKVAPRHDQWLLAASMRWVDRDR